MGFRYYDPQTGRFLTKDPIGYAGGLNLYAYTGDNPVNYIDPDGRNPMLIAGGIGLVAGGVVGGYQAWRSGGNIWVGAGRGAVIGGVAGVTGAWVGGLVGGGGGILAGMGAGGLSGAASDAVGQGVGMALGWQHAYNPAQTATAFGLGAATGGIGGALRGPCPTNVVSHDLSPGEMSQIQGVVNDVQRPVWVFGSASRGARRGIGTNLPFGKGAGTRSDIDYVILPEDLMPWQSHWQRLPDTAHGPMPTDPEPYMIGFFPK